MTISTISTGTSARRANRLGRATVGALVTLYGVNGLGERVAKSGPAGARVEYVYDLPGRLLGSYGADGAAREEIVWLGDLPVATLQGGSAYHIAPNHLGAPHQIVNAANQQVWVWDHDPFGNGAPTATAGFAHDLRFPGQIYDAETGLHSNGFRDYDPRLGRYVESDPIGLAGGINTYAYVGNNPLWAVDPLGLGPKSGTDDFWSGFLQYLSNSFDSLARAPRDIRDDPWGSIQAGLEGVAPIAPPLAMCSAGRCAAAGSGVQFAQRAISSTFRNGEFAGQSIHEVAARLRSGTISPNQLPLNVVNRNGVTYTMNNQSLMTLRLGGEKPTLLNDVTGNPFFENQLTQRLNEIGPNTGPNFVPIIRGQ